MGILTKAMVTDTQIIDSKKFTNMPIELNGQSVSIVIPMYNEAKTISSVLQKVPPLPNCEILVVDDGSKDDSAEIATQYERVKLIRHKNNKGYGQSIIDGIQKADGDIIVTMDSDGQ